VKQIASIVVFMLGVPGVAWSQVYRCDAGGETHFSDLPCGDGSERITVRDNRIGGSFGQNLPAEPEPEEADDQSSPRKNKPRTLAALSTPLT
jgi:hypothetical protein